MSEPTMEWYRRNVPTALSLTGAEMPAEWHREHFDAALEADRKTQRERQTLDLRQQGRLLPNPNSECVCTPYTEDHGPGYVEHLLEYEPACPEHSEHVYDPRSGEWILRTPDQAESARLRAELETGRCLCVKVWAQDDDFTEAAYLELDPTCPQHSIEIHDLRNDTRWKPAP